MNILMGTKIEFLFYQKFSFKRGLHRGVRNLNHSRVNALHQISIHICRFQGDSVNCKTTRNFSQLCQNYSESGENMPASHRSTYS